MLHVGIIFWCDEFSTTSVLAGPLVGWCLEEGCPQKIFEDILTVTQIGKCCAVSDIRWPVGPSILFWNHCSAEHVERSYT